MEPPTLTNPVVAARRLAEHLTRTQRAPDWALTLVALGDPRRPPEWSEEERRRWRRIWRLLKP
jgi:hypothetical protein